MAQTGIYEDVARRTGGNIYIGVVGPVRTGKSTFIKRFMETAVIPGITDEYLRARALDELPQSGSGKTIMTAEPKFVPEEAAALPLPDGSQVRLRLVDCVGYMVDGAGGATEEGTERMVTTPWLEQEIPLSQAAEIGTRKVITEHATIGVVVTTDGTVTGIPRENYLPAEERVIRELQEIGKPFIVLLNSAQPESETAQALREELADKYGVPCLAVNCMTLSAQEITRLIHSILYEFPVGAVELDLPDWLMALPLEHPLGQKLRTMIRTAGEGLHRLRDVRRFAETLETAEEVESATFVKAEPALGSFRIRLELPRSLFYDTVSSESGFALRDDGDLMRLLAGLGPMKEKYDRVAAALTAAEETGYGVVEPSREEMTLQKPEIVRRGGRYSVCLKASAPSIHMRRSKRKGVF